MNEFRTAYGPKLVVTTGPFEKTMTKQAFKDEADINFIIGRFRKTGLIEHINERAPHYGDYSKPTDFHTAMTVVAEANSMFASLPSDIRKEFDNDPGKFLEFAENPDNIDRMVELGLAEPVVPPPAQQGTAPTPGNAANQQDGGPAPAPPTPAQPPEGGT